VLGCSLSVVTASNRSTDKVIPRKLEITAPSECDLFENSVQKVFNGKKNSSIRVICIIKPEEEIRADTSTKQILAGTGFFISDKAHVLTAASIVKNAQMIRIDYMVSSSAAEYIGIDVHTNGAVLRLLQPPSEFGIGDVSENNTKMQREIGSFLVFVGCKFGMDPLPELGNVTGKNISYGDNILLTTYLRTNLMFCGGESGAPVFELNENLSGMMIASLSKTNSNFILPR
jgi:S1-C subfamily serine protease